MLLLSPILHIEKLRFNNLPQFSQLSVELQFELWTLWSCLPRYLPSAQRISHVYFYYFSLVLTPWLKRVEFNHDLFINLSIYSIVSY